MMKNTLAIEVSVKAGGGGNRHLVDHAADDEHQHQFADDQTPKQYLVLKNREDETFVRQDNHRCDTGDGQC